VSLTRPGSRSPTLPAQFVQMILSFWILFLRMCRYPLARHDPLCLQVHSAPPPRSHSRLMTSPCPSRLPASRRLPPGPGWAPPATGQRPLSLLRRQHTAINHLQPRLHRQHRCPNRRPRLCRPLHHRGPPPRCHRRLRRPSCHRRPPPHRSSPPPAVECPLLLCRTSTLVDSILLLVLRPYPRVSCLFLR
jgi:hypothetical protein